jgi:hypothetical protein
MEAAKHYDGLVLLEVEDHAIVGRAGILQGKGYDGLC